MQGELMKVLVELKKIAKHRKKSRSLEYVFYKENEQKLRKYPYFDKCLSDNKDFRIIQSNIIIRGLINKEIIDKKIIEYKNECITKNKKPNSKELKGIINDAIVDLPYLNDKNNHRIYIPFFSKALNVIYLDEPIKLLNYPYDELLNDFSSSVIDAFETYNYELYDSYFSKMIRSVSDKTSMAFFNVDDYFIYVIDNQGRLDLIIYTFDKYIAEINVKDFIKRVNNLMTVFYKNDRMEFIKALYIERFISLRTYKKILGKLRQEK